MLRVLALLGSLCCASAADAAEVVTVGPWQLHSSFWMSLHQTLIEDAMTSPARDAGGLTPDERASWSSSVDTYRAAGGQGNLTFAKPMQITTDALTQVADDASEPLIDAPLAEALASAAPVYREHWWAADDRANRFFIGYAAAMLREAGSDLVRQHEAVYRSAWPTRIRVYITPSAGPFGAYTIEGFAGGVITTMACRDEGYQGLRALEMLLHEGSHALVNPNRGTVADAIAAAAAANEIAVPRGLWHAILFATSSELTRRALVERGVTSFVPSSEDLFSRVWPDYRGPIEQHWYPYLEGVGSLEQAIGRIFAELSV